MSTAYTLEKSTDYGYSWVFEADAGETEAAAKELLAEVRKDLPKKNGLTRYRLSYTAPEKVVPDYKNKVELLGYYGSDELHACSAWTSTSRDLPEEKRARIPAMLKGLAEAGHHTPFEKSSLHFLVDSEIASHIHLLKHRVGVSINAESARYKELKEDKFYIPEDFYTVPVDAKHEISRAFQNWGEILADRSIQNDRLYHACLEDIAAAGQGRKRAKESARFFKMYNSQIESDIMFNWRSFAHFQNLRGSHEAQREIRSIAAKMLRLVEEIPGNPFKHTIAAFDL